MDGWFSVARKLLDDPMWTKEPFTRGQAWIDLIGLANHKAGFIRVRGQRIDIARGQVGWSVAALAKRWQWSQGKVTRFFRELEDDEQIEAQKSHVSSVVTIVNYDTYQQNGAQNGAQTENRAELPQSVASEGDTSKQPKNGHVTMSQKRTENGAQNGEQKSPISSIGINTCGANARHNGEQNGAQTERRRSADGEQTGTNNKNNKNNNEDKDTTTKRFVPPSAEEVASYAQSIGYDLDGSTFVDSYQAKGWMIGKTRMKDWKAAVRTWKRNERKESTHERTRTDRRAHGPTRTHDDILGQEYGELIDPITGKRDLHAMRE